MEPTVHSPSIESPESALTPALNFETLKRLGLDTIIESSSKTWTDYNEHDPGITILEVLCFALTDLAYRTSFPIKDLLTVQPTPSGESGSSPFVDKQFYRAREILTTSSVTASDFRKQIIDLDGVKNAWIHPWEAPSNPVGGLSEVVIDPTDQQAEAMRPYDGLRVELARREQVQLKKELARLAPTSARENAPVVSNALLTCLLKIWNLPTEVHDELGQCLRSLLKVEPGAAEPLRESLEFLTLDPPPLGWSPSRRRAVLFDGIHQTFFSPQFQDSEWIPSGLRYALLQLVDAECAHSELVERIRRSFHQARPLGQDLGGLTIRRPLPLVVELHLTLVPNADHEQTIADALYRIDRALSESVQFLSLQEMLKASGEDVNQVFSGPALQHGFITGQSLCPLMTMLRSNEVMPLIEAIPSVHAVTRLRFATLGSDGLRGKWHQDLRLPPDRRPVLGPLCEQCVSIPVDQHALRLEFEELVRKRGAAKLAAKARDLPIPTGRFRNVDHYSTIQDEFPRIYALQEPDLLKDQDGRPSGEVRQLKAFLLIFDQILADYLAQLAHVGELFSWSPSVHRTNFFQGLEHAVGSLGDLIEDFPLSHSQGGGRVEDENLRSAIDGYHRKLAEFREDPATFKERRNQFLDHQLARLGRNLNDFTRSLSDVSGGLGKMSEIDAKLAVLGRYCELSGRRGAGSDLLGASDSPPNVSGLRLWIESLFGFEPETSSICSFTEQFVQARLEGNRSDGRLLASHVLKTRDGSPVDMDAVMRIGTVAENYHIDPFRRSVVAADQKAWESYGLKLISSASTSGTSEAIPVQGKSLVVIANMDDVFFFRVFDSQGQRVIDISEALLNEFPSDLARLRSELAGLWDRGEIPPNVRESVIHTVASVLGVWLSFDLQLMSLPAVGDGPEMPIEGSGLVIIARMEDTLFFRVFDRLGRVTVDIYEGRLAEVETQIEALKKQLAPLWQKPFVPADQKKRIIADVASFVGQTHRLLLIPPVPDQDTSSAYELVASFAGVEEASMAAEELAQLLSRYDRASERVYLIEHALLRPGSDERVYGLDLLDSAGDPWLSTHHFHPQPVINQVRPAETANEITYAVQDVIGNTVVKTVNRQMPFTVLTTRPLPTPATSSESPSPEYWFSLWHEQGPLQPRVAIRMSFGHSLKRSSDGGSPVVPEDEQRVVELESSTPIQSVEEANRLIDSWVERVALGMPSGKLWKARFKPQSTEIVGADFPLRDDPYSFVVTAVVPQWPRRFQDPKFCQLLEDTLHAEAPAHLWIDVLWLDKPDFQRFMELRESWKESMSTPGPASNWPRRALLDFILSHCASRDREH